jgi:hypothetical protein
LNNDREPKPYRQGFARAELIPAATSGASAAANFVPPEIWKCALSTKSASVMEAKSRLLARRVGLAAADLASQWGQRADDQLRFGKGIADHRDQGSVLIGCATVRSNVEHDDVRPDCE